MSHTDPSTYELERRYLNDAEFHARVYAFTAGRCKHDQSPCDACILDSLKRVARVPFLGADAVLKPYGQGPITDAELESVDFDTLYPISGEHGDTQQ